MPTPMVSSPELLSAVFPWSRHLSEEETRQFMADLVDAVSDAAERDVQADVHRVVTEWRATARTVADPGQPRQATRRPADADRAGDRAGAAVPGEKGVEGSE
ncbi:DUF6247 family protein [Streptomyces sp. NPDC047000]|uniref:DUF6247 family protein n=1 Tax=Streptomyces sp. NPDC047000 TaxID=3155474 RepID=UPI0033F40576